MPTEAVRIREVDKEWLDQKKLDYFNTTEVTYSTTIKKLIEEYEKLEDQN